MSISDIIKDICGSVNPSKVDKNEAPEGFIAVEDDDDDKCSPDCALLGCSSCAQAVCSRKIERIKPLSISSKKKGWRKPWKNTKR